jgi:hypothetical protein
MARRSLSPDLQAIKAAPLVTARYSSWRPELGVPIRTSVGHPRFWRRGVPLLQMRSVTPHGVFRNPTLHTVSEQRVAYLARLEDLADDIVAELAALAHAFPGKALVVLCFEDLTKGECHRRWFAEWFEGRYGIEVPEVS